MRVRRTYEGIENTVVAERLCAEMREARSAIDEGIKVLFAKCQYPRVSYCHRIIHCLEADKAG